MKYIKIIILILGYYLGQSFVFAQVQKADSLTNMLKVSKEDTGKVNILNALAYEYRSNNPDTAVKIATEGLLLAKKLKFAKGKADAYVMLGSAHINLGNYTQAFQYADTVFSITTDKTILSKCHQNIGLANYYQGNYDSALENFKKALDVKLEIGDKYGAASCYNNIGNVYSNEGEYDLAFKNHTSALKLRDEINDKKGIADSYNNLSILHLYKSNYPEALKIQFKILRIREDINDKTGIGNSYNNIGTAYQLQKQYDEALEYHKKALKVREEVGDKWGIAGSYTNIGNTYQEMGKQEDSYQYFLKALELDKQIGDKKGIAFAMYNIANYHFEKNNYQEALKMHLEVMKMREEVKDNWGLSSSYTNIGQAYSGLKNNKEAALWYQKGLKLALELGNKEAISENCYELAQLSIEKGEWQKAYKYYHDYSVYKDSLYNEENTQKITQQQMQYEFDKKESITKLIQEKKDAIAKEEKQKQQIILYASLLGLLMLLLFLLFVYNRLKLTQRQKKTIEKQKIEVEEQREVAEQRRKVAEEQKMIIESKNHEITQSIQYAQKIQSALLPNEEIFRSIFPNSFVIFKPKDIVSGDFYWISNQERYIFYATADSTGHGVPGGFMSMLGTALLNEIIDERKIDDCGQVLTLMREKIMQALKQAGDSESKDGMDMVLIRIDKQKLEMQYAAANNSLYIVSNKQSAISNEYCLLQTVNCQLYELPCDKMPVGVYHSEVKPFKTYLHQLQKGDAIYTYTDGYADQFGGDNGKKYTYKKLRENLVDISGQPLEKQKHILENEFENWKNGQDQIDDVCLIGVKI